MSRLRNPRRRRCCRHLDGFRGHPNQERPHQGIGNQTPAERYRPLWQGGPRGQGDPEYPPRSVIRTVKATESLIYDFLQINIGIRFASAKVRVIEDGALIHIYFGNELVRTLAPDRSRSYQPRITDRREEAPIYTGKDCLSTHGNAVSHLTRARTRRHRMAKHGNTIAAAGPWLRQTAKHGERWRCVSS